MNGTCQPSPGISSGVSRGSIVPPQHCSRCRSQFLRPTVMLAWAYNMWSSYKTRQMNDSRGKELRRLETDHTEYAQLLPACLNCHTRTVGSHSPGTKQSLSCTMYRVVWRVYLVSHLAAPFSPLLQHLITLLQHLITFNTSSPCCNLRAFSE